MAAELGEPKLLLINATVELSALRFDDDYRVKSGFRVWVAEYVPGSRHTDLLGVLPMLDGQIVTRYAGLSHIPLVVLTYRCGSMLEEQD